ncbi:MAG: ATP-binding cassette domain-containing protein [Planctomycetes bacterium]|nr:ATP-binding cassette domain-containing protein [Planctomycetota bacterium]
MTLELSNITVTAGKRRLLHEFSLTLAPGQFVALLGPNGAGKTTIARAALGLVAAQGDVTLDGKPVRGMPGRERASKIAWLPQQSLIDEPLRAVDVACAARFRFNESRASCEKAALAALKRAGAWDFACEPVTRLSGGEHQRVALAALLAQEAPLLILDEPANHLDPAQQIAIYRLMGELWREGRGILCITHDINLIAHTLGDRKPEEIRVIGLAGGATRFESDFGAADLDGKLGDLFGAQIHALSDNGRRVFIAEAAKP